MKELEQLEKRMEEVAGQWNGDAPGLAEDRAHVALEIIEKIEQIKLLLQSEYFNV